MMLAQGRARDGEAEAIQAAVMARAGRAGTKALDDKRTLLEREVRGARAGEVNKDPNAWCAGMPFPHYLYLGDTTSIC